MVKDDSANIAVDGRQRSEFDQLLSRRLHEVAAPAGALDRLKARLAEVQPSTDPERVIEIDRAPGKAMAAAAAISRRRLAELFAVAASLLVVVGWWNWPRRADLDLAQLTHMAADWADQLPDELWKRDAPLPAGFVQSRHLSAPLGWQRADDFVGIPSLALQLSGRSVAFVLKVKIPGLPQAPPGQPQLASAGRATGCWQEGGQVVAVTAPGDARSYRRCLRVLSEPVAWNGPQSAGVLR